MRPVSDFLIDQEATLTLSAWDTDADGGRMLASTIVRRWVPCAYLPGKGQRFVVDDPSTGLRRVTQVIPIGFGFTEDYGIHIDDLVTWTDESDVTHVYQVTSYGQPAGQSGWWVATCEERT
jgi:hypothetical protein